MTCSLCQQNEGTMGPYRFVIITSCNGSENDQGFISEIKMMFCMDCSLSIKGITLTTQTPDEEVTP